MDRRRFITRAGKGLGAWALSESVLGCWEARWSGQDAEASAPPLPPFRFLLKETGHTFSRPFFAPSGEKLLFMRAPAAQDSEAADLVDAARWSFWTVPVDGGAAEPLFEHEEISATRPAWSWETGWIAFTGVGKNGAGLWLLDEDGENLRHVPVGDSTRERIYYPSWYPDGRSVAVTDYSKRQVLRVDVEAGATEPLTDPDRVWAGMASVSPDSAAGNPLAFAGQEPGDRYIVHRNQIWIQYPDRDPYPLDDLEGRNPAWSPADDRIAFASIRKRPAPTYVLHPRLFGSYEGIAAIYVKGVHGAGVATDAAVGLTPFGYEAVQPKWSPDGTKIVCTAYSLASGQRGIGVIDLAGAVL